MSSPELPMTDEEVPAASSPIGRSLRRELCPANRKPPRARGDDTVPGARFVALSGSLRRGSTNTALLRDIAVRAPKGVTIKLLPLGKLPLFNPDLEARLPRAVAGFRAEVGLADALIIASPEYAHGISGVLKNALDWLVGYEGFAGKPVMVLNAAPRAHHAISALRETLSTMAAKIVDDIPVIASAISIDQ